MRILVVPTTDWLRPVVPTRLHHIFERISARNEVHIIRFDFGYGKLLETKTIIHDIKNFAFRVYGKWLPAYYLVSYPRFKSEINSILRMFDFDAIVLSNLLPAYAGARADVENVNTVFDLSDHFPLSAIEYLPKNSLIRASSVHILERLLHATLARVDLTITSCYTLQSYAIRMGAKKTSVIYNGVDNHFLSYNKNHEEIREKLGLGDSLVVGFVGAIRDYYDMDSLLSAIKRISRKVSVKFLVLGRNIQEPSIERFKKKVVELKLKEYIVWPEYLPFDKIPDYIDAMDICTIPLDSSKKITHYLAPVKLWEYLARGKPVISAPLLEIRRQASQFVYFASTEMDYYNFFMRYLRNPESFIEVGELAKDEAYKHTWNVIASEYEKHLKYV